MSHDAAIRRALLGGVPELAETPVAYRLILAAERAGELTVYRKASK